jgi:hypothetical protein
MRRSFRYAGPLMLLLVCAIPAGAQKNSLGLNLRISGSPDVGITWFISSSVAIRPSLAANSVTVESPTGDSKLSRVSLTTDVLFNARAIERIRMYVGVGGTVSKLRSDVLPDQTTWGFRTLFGARVTVIERVAFFGEIALNYERGDEGERQIALATLPLGIVVFLR